jgi:hypothetical protein
MENENAALPGQVISTYPLTPRNDFRLVMYTYLLLVSMEFAGC